MKKCKNIPAKYSKRHFNAMRNKIMKNVLKLNMGVWPEVLQFFFDGRKMNLYVQIFC